MAWIAQEKLQNRDLSEVRTLIDDFVETSRNLNISKYPPGGLFEKYMRRAYSENILDQMYSVLDLVNEKYHGNTHVGLLKLAVISLTEEVSRIRKHGSHYRYLDKSESIGLQKLNIKIMPDSTVIVPLVINKLEQMYEDLQTIDFSNASVGSKIINANTLNHDFGEDSYDAVITSPPYLNRNNYIAQQKAEMSLLGIAPDKEMYGRLIQEMLTSHVDRKFSGNVMSGMPEVSKIIDRLSLSTGNNAKIPHMIAGYFDDLTNVFTSLEKSVKPDGTVSFVVGCSRWGGVVIPVDHLIMKIGESHGFEPVSILVTRLKGNSPQQMKQFGRIPVRESIVIMRKT